MLFGNRKLSDNSSWQIRFSSGSGILLVEGRRYKACTKSLVPAVPWSDHFEATYSSESWRVKFPKVVDKNRVPSWVTGSSLGAHTSQICKESALGPLAFFGAEGGNSRTSRCPTGKLGKALATGQNHQHEKPGEQGGCRREWQYQSAPSLGIQDKAEKKGQNRRDASLKANLMLL